MQTYKSSTFMEAILPTIKKLHNKHKNPINFLKTAWVEIAPQWAVLAEPYMIRKETLIMRTSSQHAIMLQYREQELIAVINTILSQSPITRVKIITS